MTTTTRTPARSYVDPTTPPRVVWDAAVRVLVRWADTVHAPADEADRAAGLTVTRAGLTGRVVSHPGFAGRVAR